MAHSNLDHNDSRKSTYWEVTEPFPAYIVDQLVESNSLYGASAVYGKLYVRVMLPVGAVIHHAPAGDFVNRPDFGYSERVFYGKPESDSFENAGMGGREDWPLEYLAAAEEVEFVAAPRPEVLSMDSARALGARNDGRSLDWIIDNTF